MCHNDYRVAKLIAQVEEQVVQLALVAGVEAARRLVGQYDSRLVYQCTCHGYALFLATR